MKTRDNTKGERIIKIVNGSNPKGIGFRELSRKSAISRGGIEWWLKYLRSIKIIQNSLPILLTPLANQHLQQGMLSLPKVQRSKKFNDPIQKKSRKEKNQVDKTRSQKIILLILMKAVFGSSIFFRTNTPKAGDVGVYDPVERKTLLPYSDITLPGIGIDDIIYKSPIQDSDSPNKEAFMPENRFNIDNNDMFNYLRILKEEGQRYIDFLVNHNPTVLKPLDRGNIVNTNSSKLKYGYIKKDHKRELGLESNSIQLIRQRYFNEQRYEIADNLLKEFISNYILIFNSEIEPLLECKYIEGNLKTSDNKVNDNIKIYKKWLISLYGNTNKIFELFAIQDDKRNKLKNPIIKKNNSKKKGFQMMIKEHYKVIYSNSIFDNNLDIQAKYDILKKIHPVVWASLLFLLPDKIKTIIKDGYKTKGKIINS